VICAIGCESDPARQRSQQAVKMLVDTRGGLVASEGNVANSLIALRTLQSAQGDLRPAFEAFREQLEIIRRDADRIRIEADDMRSQADGFCAAWRNDVATITDQRIRQAGEDRANLVRTKYTHIDELYTQVNNGYAHYLRNLLDLQTYLVNDLNFPALQTAQPWLTEASQAGETLRHSINQLASELGETTNILSPVPIPQRLSTTTPAVTTNRSPVTAPAPVIIPATAPQTRPVPQSRPALQTRPATQP
jgi:hypothetical protein